MLLEAFLPQCAAADIGIKGGLAWSKFAMAGNSLYYFVNHIAPAAGVYFNLSLGSMTLQPEIFYIRMRTGREGGIWTETRASFAGLEPEPCIAWPEERLDYLQIPVLLRVNIIAGPISPFAFAGPYTSLLLAAKGLTEVASGPIVEDLKAAYKPLDYGFVLGGGLALRAAAVKLSVEVRYIVGLANVAKDQGPGFSLMNRSILLLAGIGL